MAEVYRAVTTGEMAQLFHQFLEMQTQQALFAMGRHPGRPAGAPPANPRLAQVYLDHLNMLAVKTDGNLSDTERRALETTIAMLTGIFQELDAEKSRRSGDGGEEELA
jgi:hypothetical protein